MTEDQKSIAERAEYHKGNLEDLTKNEIVHFLPAVLANKDAVIAELRAALAKVEQVKPVAPVRPMSDEQISLMAHNEDQGDWINLRLRDSWHEGYMKGFRAAEAHIKGATE